MSKSNDINDAETQAPLFKAVARFAAAAIGAGIAEMATLPIDIGKVRLQLQKPLKNGTMKYRNFLQAGYRIGVDEGVLSLWKGAVPALTRQISYTGFSLVFYEPIRDFIAGSTPVDELGFMWRLLAGGAAGGMSIALMNPTDVVKTQLQSSAVKLEMGPVIRQVYRADGVAGFWAGVKPNVARCFIGNACELGFYDQAKTFIESSEAIPLAGSGAHFAAASFAGFMSALVSCPLDVVRTRLFNEAGRVAGAREHAGFLDALASIPRREGLGALYRGFAPMVTRKVTWTALFFLSYEQAKFLVGHGQRP